MIGIMKQNFRLAAALLPLAAACAMCATPLAAQNPPPAQTPAETPKTPAESARKDLLTQFNESLQELTARVTPSIVQVQVTGYRAIEEKSQDEANLIGRQRSLGSGVIVDPEGYIITNAHVVKGAQRVRVVLTPASSGDSQVRASLGLGEHSPPIDARIIGIAPVIDLALLKIEQKNLPAVAFA
jgi:serine protease Do